MSHNPDHKKTCEDFQQNLADMSELTNSDHQENFIAVIRNGIAQLDYRLKYPNGISHVDEMNVRIARTSLAFILNLIILKYVQFDRLMVDHRPDLIESINQLVDDLESILPNKRREYSNIDLTNLGELTEASENFVRTFYNPPRPSAFQRTTRRVVGNLLMIIRGTKG